MSIFADFGPAGPDNIRIPQHIRLYGQGWGKPPEDQTLFSAAYIQLNRVWWSSFGEVRGIPSRRSSSDGPWGKAQHNVFPAYRCEHCKTTFIGKEWSDFAHDCVLSGEKKRAA